MYVQCLIAHGVPIYTACAGTTDADCAIWDHVVQLFVCCDDGEPSSSGGGGGGAERPCDKCDSTVWLASHRPGTAFHHDLLAGAHRMWLGAGAPVLYTSVHQVAVAS